MSDNLRSFDDAMESLGLPVLEVTENDREIAYRGFFLYMQPEYVARMRQFAALQAEVNYLRAAAVFNALDRRILHSVAWAAHSTLENCDEDSLEIYEVDHRHLCDAMERYNERWPDSLITPMSELCGESDSLSPSGDAAVVGAGALAGVGEGGGAVAAGAGGDGAPVGVSPVEMRPADPCAVRRSIAVRPGHQHQQQHKGEWHGTSVRPLAPAPQQSLVTRRGPVSRFGMEADRVVPGSGLEPVQ